MAEKRSLKYIIRRHIESGKVELPVFDRTAARIRNMVDSREFEIREVEELIMSDPALSSEILRQANSVFFGGIEKVTTVGEAVMRLGVRQVAGLVMLAGQKPQYDFKDPELRKMSGDLWRHAVACGMGSRWLAHRIDPERRLVLGGVHFEGEPGLTGHSDADVVLHAAADALLGCETTPPCLR